MCNIRWGLTQICVLLIETVKMKFSIFPKEKEIETHTEKKNFFTEETVLYIGRDLKHENLVLNDHISSVKAS